MEKIPNENLPKSTDCEPIGIDVIPGKIYSWCSCGLTATTPFCDNAHRNIEDEPYRSVKVQFDKAETIWFCQCKHTKTPPFCDSTHNIVKRKSK